MINSTTEVAMSEAEADSIRIDHPNFRFVGERAVNGYPYVVFERPLYNDPTPEQIADYRKRQETVESLGGRMTISEYEIAGQTLVFTAAECETMCAAVEASLPEWEVIETWNGRGCRTLSVGIRRRRTEG
jgi:hypothetical protein